MLHRRRYNWVWVVYVQRHKQSSWVRLFVYTCGSVRTAMHTALALVRITNTCRPQSQPNSIMAQCGVFSIIFEIINKYLDRMQASLDLPHFESFLSSVRTSKPFEESLILIRLTWMLCSKWFWINFSPRSRLSVKPTPVRCKWPSFLQFR